MADKQHAAIGSDIFFCDNMSKFSEQQAQRVEKLASKLHEALVSGDSGAFLARTGSLVRSATLRTRETRRAFAIILQAAPNADNDGDIRFWSKKVVEKAIKKMMVDRSLEIPQLPGFRWPTWFQNQTAVVHGLAKKAKRNLRGKSMENMDAVETLPYNPEDLGVEGGCKDVIERDI